MERARYVYDPEVEQRIQQLLDIQHRSAEDKAELEELFNMAPVDGGSHVKRLSTRERNVR